MAERDKAFLKKLVETFKDEAREHIAAISEKLSELERADATAHGPVVEVAFREAHSLKAAARAVSRTEIERLCQAMESMLAAFKRGETKPDRAALDTLHAANDALADLLAAEEGGARPIPDVEGLVRALGAGRKAEPRAAREEPRYPAREPALQEPPEGSPPAAGAADTIRLPVQRLDALLLQAEDMLSIKIGTHGHALSVGSALAGFAEWRAEWRHARGSLEAVRSLAAARPLLDFLDWTEARVKALEGIVAGLGKAAAAGARDASVRVDRLLRDLKQILMLEARTLLEGFPKVARDLAREQGKELDFVVEGAELEIDRRVLEELREPLLHLVRNAVDHGIEKPQERKRRGKPARATLRLALTPMEGGKVEFAVSDDGAGVPLKELAGSAIKAGLLSAPQAAEIGASDLLPLVFHSGLSTSSMITDLSGRGLGLAIVRERAERLGGSAALESSEGRGTTIRLVVPLTLETFRGIPVRAAGQVFVIPTLGVERVLRVQRKARRSIEGRPAIPLNGGHVPLVPLADVLEMPATGAANAANGDVAAVVVGSAGRRVAFEVEEVLGDQEVLVKPLGRFLERVRNVAGATVLSDGRIAPILNVHDLVKSAVRARARAVAAEPDMPAALAHRPRVLVVEDSVTARGLLRNILEAAGYEVKTAVDGVDAWAALKLEPFDAVVSDIEMPRMNGFDLTARIRADRRLAELPVVLVTALASREDRERGVDVGANAYLPKGEFDQAVLLDVLRRLA